jgi:hypothetical protein
VDDLARLLIIFGFVLAGLGLLLILGPRIPYIGHLPGDLLLRHGGTTIYIPLATSIILSIILTILLNLFMRR